MGDEIAEFTESAIANEFHEEALTAARAVLVALKPEQTLYREHFEEAEQRILDEAAQTLGIACPWDPQETAEIAAEQAARLQHEHEERERAELRIKQKAEVIQKAAELFKTGASHSTVRGMFPNFSNEIGQLVGNLRNQGLQIAR